MTNFKPVLLVKILVTACTGVVAVPALAEPFKHPFGELREYHRHWLAVCPDKHTPQSKSQYETNCWASTYTGDGNGSFSGAFPGNRLSVLRNRTTGEYKITFVATSADQIDATRPVLVKFSGLPVQAFTYGTSITPNENSGNEYVFASLAQTSDMVKSMRLRNRVTITMPTKTGQQTMGFSLIGLASALGFLQAHAGG